MSVLLPPLAIDFVSFLSSLDSGSSSLIPSICAVRYWAFHVSLTLLFLQLRRPFLFIANVLAACALTAFVFPGNSIAAMDFNHDGSLLAVASSYTFERGDQRSALHHLC